MLSQRIVIDAAVEASRQSALPLGVALRRHQRTRARDYLAEFNMLASIGAEARNQGALSG